MAVTIVFKSHDEAQAVAQYLYNTSVVENNLIVDFFDKVTFDLALDLENITDYSIEDSTCLLPISEYDWYKFECKELNIPRIYVACLSAYKNGYYHGIWLDATQEVSKLLEGIRFMLSWSPVRKFEPCEEYAIHYYENFADFPIFQNESLEVISQIAQFIVEYKEFCRMVE